MKLRLIVSTLPLALALAAFGQDPMPAGPAPAVPPGQTPPREGAPAMHGKKKTALDKDMDRINRAMRALKRQVSDSSQNGSSLEQVAEIRRAAEAALDETPEKAEDVPADARDRFISDYQAGMKSFLADVDKLSAALKAGDNAGAERLFKQLLSDERQGHKRFRRPPDRH